ncbi:putative P450 monooxygenase [Saccharata proteae CBS 121410]|uniref:P450 monooxygenase n=1 Tax=Saccharata proteae CBS 121410 TaxID=1314787 RepID=A0A9P4HUD8_9PEZI|nr:putative P450 monooxygenase [Saccharata proteae CBS 121410]
MIASSSPFLVYFLLILTTIFYLTKITTTFVRRRHLVRLHACKPPPKLPTSDILGLNTVKHSYTSHQNHTYLQLSQRRFRDHGTTFAATLLPGGNPVINTIDPRNIQSILARNFGDWELGSQRRSAFEPLLGKGIFCADGHAWSGSRKMLRPYFARDQIADMELFERHFQALLRCVPVSVDGISANTELSELFFQFTLDVATELFFGESCCSLQVGTKERKFEEVEFRDAFNRAQRTIANNVVVGFWAKFLGKRGQFRDDCRRVHAFVDGYVNNFIGKRARLGPKKSESGDNSKTVEKSVLLEELCQQTSDRKQVRSELVNILVAGRDTTASLLSNFWFVLAREPRVWEKLKEEVSQLQGTEITLTNLKELKYLRQCLKESLRLHPPVPINTRQARVDTVIPVGGGDDGSSPIFVPAGTRVGYNVYAMHRRPDFFGPDAETFVPERWDELRPGWEFLPFNGGPRICLGQQLALTEASYVTVRLLQEFDGVEADGGVPWTEMLTLTCSPVDSTRVRFRKK